MKFKLLNNIKIWLIHKLGGYTAIETLNDAKNSRITLMKYIYDNIKSFNGLDKQEWIDKVYNLIQQEYYNNM